MSEPLVICECSCGWNSIDSEHHGNVRMPDGTVEPPQPSNGHTFRDVRVVRVVREEDVERWQRDRHTA
jgi:hypothetical protein